MSSTVPRRSNRGVPRIDYLRLNDGNDTASLASSEINALDMIIPRKRRKVDKPEACEVSTPSPVTSATTDALRQSANLSSEQEPVLQVQTPIESRSASPESPQEPVLSMTCNSKASDSRVAQQGVAAESTGSNVWFFFSTKGVQGDYIHRTTGQIRGQKEEIRCLFPSCTYTTTNSALQGSTSNLKRHLEKHLKERKMKLPEDIRSSDQVAAILNARIPRVGQKTIEEAFSSTPSNVSFVNTRLIRFFIETDQPFQRIENKNLLEIVQKACNVSTIDKLPTVKTRRGMAKQFHKLASKVEERLKKKLDKVKNLSITFDLWSSQNNNNQLLCIIAHYVDEDTGKYEEPTIAFESFNEKRHTGANLARIILKVFERYNITHKILSITADNAANNGSALKAIENYLREYCNLMKTKYQDPPVMVSEFFKAKNTSPCFNHMLNLLSQSLLDTLCQSSKDSSEIDHNENEHDDDHDLGDFTYSIQQNISTELLAMNQAQETEGEQVNNDDIHEEEQIRVDEDGYLLDNEVMDTEMLSTSNAIQKCRSLSLLIKNITILKRLFLACCNSFDMKTIALPPVDVKTRWNSSWDMMYYFTQRRELIERFQSCIKSLDMCNIFIKDKVLLEDLEQFDKENMMKANDCFLSQQDWSMIESTTDLLRPMKDLTVFFSAKIPLFHELLQSYYRLLNYFEILLDICAHKEICSKEERFIKLFSGSQNLVGSIKRNPWMRRALINGKRKLQKYYQLLDMNDYVHISSLLDPRKKSKLLKDNIGLHESNRVLNDIREAMALFERTFFNEKEPDREAADTQTNTEDNQESESSDQGNIMFRMMSLDAETDHRGSNRRIITLLEEFDSYLYQPTLGLSECKAYLTRDTHFDVLKYWKGVSGRFPKLAVLAEAIMSIPATSTSTERKFSLARAILSYRRHRLSINSIQSSLLLKANPDIVAQLVDSNSAVGSSVTCLVNLLGKTVALYTHREFDC